MTYVVVGCRVLLGTVFVISALSKLRARGAFREFAAAVEGFGLVRPARVRAVAGAVVATEGAIPFLLLTPATVPAGLGVALGLLGIFSIAMGLVLRRGVRAPCRCFGSSANQIGTGHLVRNLLLGAAAVAGIAFAGTPGGSHPGGFAVAAVAGLVLAGLFVVADDLVELFAAPTTPGVTRGTR